jgi:heat shock protein HtpX
MPRIEIMETGALNAYAAGLSPDEAVVAVTRGLLDTLDKRELEAVLAHEMSHIRSYDVQLMMVAAVFAGGLTIVGDGLWQMLKGAGSRTEGRTSDDMPDTEDYALTSRGGGHSSKQNGSLAIAVVLAIAVLAIVHVLAKLSRFALSRARELNADAGAVELTKDADALVSALMKIGRSDVPMPDLPAVVAPMMISAAAAGLFATHPPIEERIAALEAHAGGRRAAHGPRPRGRITARPQAPEAAIPS